MDGVIHGVNSLNMSCMSCSNCMDLTDETGITSPQCHYNRGYSVGSIGYATLRVRSSATRCEVGTWIRLCMTGRRCGGRDAMRVAADLSSPPYVGFVREAEEAVIRSHMCVGVEPRIPRFYMSSSRPCTSAPQRPREIDPPSRVASYDVIQPRAPTRVRGERYPSRLV